MFKNSNIHVITYLSIGALLFFPNNSYAKTTQAITAKESFLKFLEQRYQSQSLESPILPEYSIRQAGKPVPELKVKVSYTKTIPISEPNVSYQAAESEPEFVNQQHESQQKNKIAAKNTTNEQQGFKGYLAIIIDDIGNNIALDSRAAQLDGPVTLAILPHTPHSKTVANHAHQLKKEIMLHAPMESEHKRKLGDGALTQDLTQSEFLEILQEDIDSIPHVVGMNNHMGSSLTQNATAMSWVMQSAKMNKLYFVDSRTTSQSVAGELAQQNNIQHISRNIFLDNEQNETYIHAAFEKALRISEKTGFALVIGHPYQATIDYLEKTLPELESRGFKVIPVSLLMAKKQQTLLQTKQTSELAKN